MTFQSDIWIKARAVAGPLVLSLLIVYFCFHFIQGKHGLIAYFEMNRELSALEVERQQTHARRDALALRAKQLRAGELDEDLLDEEVRRSLGFVEDGEIIIPR